MLYCYFELPSYFRRRCLKFDHSRFGWYIVWGRLSTSWKKNVLVICRRQSWSFNLVRALPFFFSTEVLLFDGPLSNCHVSWEHLSHKIFCLLSQMFCSIFFVLCASHFHFFVPCTFVHRLYILAFQYWIFLFASVFLSMPKFKSYLCNQ